MNYKMTVHRELVLMSSEQQKLPGTYSSWVGKPVYLNVITGEIRTPLFCTIIGESAATVRVRIAGMWEVDIYKEMVLAVDAFPARGNGPGTKAAGELS